MMRVILGSSTVVLVRMDFWRWAQVRSVDYDMYWPLLNMYWEVLDLGWEGFCIGGGVSIRGKGLVYANV